MKLFKKLKQRKELQEARFRIIEGKLKALEEAVYCTEYLKWKDMMLKNKELADKERNFFLNGNTDTQLLESLIQEVNKDPDLAVLLRTADGTTLSLRSYPKELNNKISSALNMFNRGE